MPSVLRALGLGVWIRTTHVGITGLPLSHTTFTTLAIYRLEPDLDG